MNENLYMMHINFPTKDYMFTASDVHSAYMPKLQKKTCAQIVYKLPNTGSLQKSYLDNCRWKNIIKHSHYIILRWKIDNNHTIYRKHTHTHRLTLIQIYLFH